MESSSSASVMPSLTIPQESYKDTRQGDYLKKAVLRVDEISTRDGGATLTFGSSAGPFAQVSFRALEQAYTKGGKKAPHWQLPLSVEFDEETKSIAIKQADYRHWEKKGMSLVPRLKETSIHLDARNKLTTLSGAPLEASLCTIPSSEFELQHQGGESHVLLQKKGTYVTCTEIKPATLNNGASAVMLKFPSTEKKRTVEAKISLAALHAAVGGKQVNWNLLWDVSINNAGRLDIRYTPVWDASRKNVQASEGSHKTRKFSWRNLGKRAIEPTFPAAKNTFDERCILAANWNKLPSLSASQSTPASPTSEAHPEIQLSGPASENYSSAPPAYRPAPPSPAGTYAAADVGRTSLLSLNTTASQDWDALRPASPVMLTLTPSVSDSSGKNWPSRINQEIVQKLTDISKEYDLKDTSVTLEFHKKPPIRGLPHTQAEADDHADMVYNNGRIQVLKHDEKTLGDAAKLTNAFNRAYCKVDGITFDSLQGSDRLQFAFCKAAGKVGFPVTNEVTPLQQDQRHPGGARSSSSSHPGFQQGR